MKLAAAVLTGNSVLNSVLTAVNRQIENWLLLLKWVITVATASTAIVQPYCSAMQRLYEDTPQPVIRQPHKDPAIEPDGRPRRCFCKPARCAGQVSDFTTVQPYRLSRLSFLDLRQVNQGFAQSD